MVSLKDISLKYPDKIMNELNRVQTYSFIMKTLLTVPLVNKNM